MNYLFIHNHYPAQFRTLAAHLASTPENTVFFLTEGRRTDITLPGVQVGIVPVSKATEPSPYLMERSISKAMRRAESFAAAMQRLRFSGFRPDIIYYHGGWGSGIFSGDIFPDARRINYSEWFFNNKYPVDITEKVLQNPGNIAGIHAVNFMHLHALNDAHMCISPTEWQKQQHPKEFLKKISVVHDGIDTDFFAPQRDQRAALIKELGLNMPTDPDEAELVTYSSRAFEPTRGFPQFFRSIPHILKSRPKCHIVIMGDDKVVYDPKRTDGRTWLQAMQGEISIPPGRVHILNFTAYRHYRRLLQASDLHIYLTLPFLLSWSMLEAMSCGCLVVASDTQPVREVARPGHNMFTVPFDEPETLAAQVADALARKNELEPMRAAARQTILDNYSIRRTLPIQLRLMHKA